MKSPFRPVAEAIERVEGLDPVADAVQSAVRPFVPPGPLKDLLSGTWLGHPVHPMLTDVTVGSWTSSFLLDVLGGEEMEGEADLLLGLGCLSALPTAAAGLSDWLDTRGPARRVGLVHAAGNLLALGLYTTAFLARRRGRRGSGTFLAMLGGGVASFTAYLGGHLSFGQGVGVAETAFETRPSDWTDVLGEGDLAEGEPKRVLAAGAPVMLYRAAGSIHAIGDRCTHRGCSLSDGAVDDDLVVTCPCHGSRFRLEEGSIVRGPATAPQPAYEARARAGRIEVRPPG